MLWNKNPIRTNKIISVNVAECKHQHHNLIFSLAVEIITLTLFSLNFVVCENGHIQQLTYNY